MSDRPPDATLEAFAQGRWSSRDIALQAHLAGCAVCNDLPAVLRRAADPSPSERPRSAPSARTWWAPATTRSSTRSSRALGATAAARIPRDSSFLWRDAHGALAAARG